MPEQRSLVGSTPTSSLDKSILRTSTVRAEIQAIKDFIITLPHPQDPDLALMVQLAETYLQRFAETGTQTKTYGPTFSTPAIAKRPERDMELHFLDFENQTIYIKNVVILAHRIEYLLLTRNQYGLKPLTITYSTPNYPQPAHEFITSLSSYTIKAPVPLYEDDEPSFTGPDLDRHQSHKTALDGLSTSLNKQVQVLSTRNESQPEQRTRLAEYDFMSNMAVLSEKANGWRREMESTDEAIEKARSIMMRT
ncbi:MAG: hypothetical protein Q9169_004261 [Polycauliona sp. 2 TL-2023]